MTVAETRAYFREHYGYIHIEDVDDATIQSQLDKPYMAGRSESSQMDCMQDFLMSQGKCGYTE